MECQFSSFLQSQLRVIVSSSIGRPTWLIGSTVDDKVAIALHYHPVNFLIWAKVQLECLDKLVFPDRELTSITIKN